MKESASAAQKGESWIEIFLVSKNRGKNLLQNDVFIIRIIHTLSRYDFKFQLIF